MKHKFYFVGSSGDAPDQVYFNLEDAQSDLHRYIDIFNSKGHPLCVMEINRDATYPKIDLEKLE